MKKIILGVLAAIALGVVVFVATADSKETKAAKQFASAQELAAKGDRSRALVALRNALQNDPALRDARIMFADLLLQANRKADAYGQYRQLYQTNPEDAEAARAMANIAFDSLSWDDARRYSSEVLARHPDDTAMQVIALGLDYRDSIAAKDADATERAASGAARMLAADPALIQARRILLADNLRNGNLDNALRLTDEGIALTPDDRDLQNTRLLLLERLGQEDAFERQLLDMVARYPKDADLGHTLVRYYVSRGRIDEAEQSLRASITPDGTKSEPRMILLRFLHEIRSPAAMRDELDQTLAQDPLPKDVASNLTEFRLLKAQADFGLGNQQQAMATLEGMINGAEPSAEIDSVKVQLARMRMTTGNNVGARALIEEVLARDTSQTDAQKMKSAWLIDEDQTDAAIALLRDALADTPNDAQILTLLARAYERAGRPELMSDMLARAVEVSNQAPEESLRYGMWLFQKGEYASVESVVIDALRRQPNNLDLLVLLARTHLAMSDWGRAQQDIDAIGQRFDTEQARNTATELRAMLLSGQGRNDELTQFLDQLSRNTNDPLGVRMAIIRNMVAGGHLGQALIEAETLSQENPQAPQAALLVVQLKLAQGQKDAALESLRSIIAAYPDLMPARLMLQAIQITDGDFDAAGQTITSALEQQPGNRMLLLAQAAVQEKQGNIDGAIATYDGLYSQNSNDLIVANNLASLLATTRNDTESLERAWTVARRLNGAEHPAFQDTYGWIAFRRGETDKALPILEQSARGLPEDPSVAYHLGRAYAAQGRNNEAKAAYDQADDLLKRGIIAYPALADDLVRARADLK